MPKRHIQLAERNSKDFVLAAISRRETLATDWKESFICQINISIANLIFPVNKNKNTN